MSLFDLRLEVMATIGKSMDDLLEKFLKLHNIKFNQRRF